MMARQSTYVSHTERRVLRKPGLYAELVLVGGGNLARGVDSVETRRT